jgi:tetratricopeptide (TPR) repeat protein
MIRRFLCIAAVAAAVCLHAAAATDQWVEIRSPHFTVATDTNEKQGRHIADQFERMRWVFQTLFPKVNVDPPEPIVVVAAKNEKVFNAIEPAAFLAKGQMKLGGLFIHTEEKNYILLQLDAEYEHPFASVYHEYTHVQFAPAEAWLPLWLNEGMAEFMQNTEIHNKDVELGQPSVDDLLYLRQNRLIPLDVLFKVDASSPYYHEENKGSIFYAESWALTHYLMVTDREKNTQMLHTYAELVSHNEDPVTAGEKAFGDLKKFQSTLESYIRSANYKQFVLSSAAAPIDESIYKVSVLTPIDAEALRADVLAYVQRTADSRALLESLLKEDPNNVQAHETMGFLEIRAGNRDEARKWYGEAVKLGSQDYLAHFYYAELSMDASVDDKDVETSLRTAIQLNPRFAPSYGRLAAFYAMRHENLDEAHTLSLHAVELDPSNVIFRINSANVLMEMGRESDALAVLKSAAKVAKKPTEVLMVQQQIEQIQRFRDARAEAETERNDKSPVQVSEQVTLADEGPKHPTMPATGPKHSVIGVIHGVVCNYPSKLEFNVDAGGGKKVALYNNEFQKINLTVLGFTPKGSMNPCNDFEGMKARVQYVVSTDKSVDGQVVAVELRK